MREDNPSPKFRLLEEAQTTRRPLVPMVVFIAVAIVACQDGADDWAVAQAPPERAKPGAAIEREGVLPLEFNACDLISVEEAMEAAGVAVREPPQSRWGATNVTCIFHPRDGDSSWPGAVYLEVDADEREYEKYLELAGEITGNQDETIEMLDSVGDHALYLYSTFRWHGIVVAAEGYTVPVIVRDNTQTDNREQAIDLVRRVVQRLL